MGPRCICIWDGLYSRLVADPTCPALGKHSDERPPFNPIDRALPPLGYLAISPPTITQSQMEFRGCS